MDRAYAAGVTDASLASAERAPWRLRLPVVGEAALCTGLSIVAASLLVSLFLTHGFTLWDNVWWAGRYAFLDYSVPRAGVVASRPRERARRAACGRRAPTTLRRFSQPRPAGESDVEAARLADDRDDESGV